MVNEQYLSSNLKSKIDKLFVKKLRMNLLKDGFISFEEIKKNSKYLKGLYKTVNKNESFVKIGFVDTTSPEFKNRNRFDFEISMVNDLDLAFKDVTGDFLNNMIKNNLDFYLSQTLQQLKYLEVLKIKLLQLVSLFIHIDKNKTQNMLVLSRDIKLLYQILIQLKFNQTILNVEVLGMVRL